MGVVNTTYTFSGTDTITSSKMNNIIDDTTFTDDAIIGTTLEVAAGKLKIRSQGITSNELGENCVITSKVINEAITSEKLSPTAQTQTIADSTVTSTKMNGGQSGSAPVFGARAYGAFDGTATSPITPIKAGNIASITRTATGSFTVVMTTAMADSSYCVVANATHPIGTTFGSNCYVTITSNTTFVIATGQVSSGSGYNPINVNFVVFQ